jgi:hypothetical protein
VSLLAAHLTDENHEELLSEARHKSKRDVERLVASLDPQPDFAASVRRLPVAVDRQRVTPSLVVAEGTAGDECVVTPALLMTTSESRVTSPPAYLAPASCGAVVAPLSADRYLLKVTLSQETHAKLERVRDLLRHSVPNGDPAAIVDRALTVLLEQLEKTRHAATGRPRPRPTRTTGSRHVPASVKRAVWSRDEGRCAFVGADGRCRATGFLEFHHVVPFALGGATSVENLQLHCRAHNAHEAEQVFGAPAGLPSFSRSSALSGQSSQSPLSFPT